VTRRSWRRLFRQRLGLQTRFTLVAAGAVAATALAITAVAFLAIRTDLENQIQQQLTARAASVEHAADQLHGHIPDGWVPPHSNRFGANTAYTQVITASGGVWTAGGNTGVLSPDAADLAVARGDSAAFFANRTVGGTRSAVLTTPLAPGLALQVAESLSTTDVEVANVGATLAVLSAIGIMAATVLGWAVARAGLAPVARLAGVTELARGETPAAGGEAWGPVRLDEVAATAVEAARRDWPKTEFSAELDSCVVEGSADRLRVAIRNLLDNAAKFGPPEGPVDVRLAGGSLTVRDHGPGISPDDAPHVFDRFYRSLSARAVPGSGLGLAVVREVARGHSGSVAAENAPGGGAVIRLTLPAG
jgi:signal transduction histidine kinase